MKLPKLLSTTEAAERLGITAQTVLYHCERGHFPNAQQVGYARLWVIPEPDLEGLVHKPPGPQRKRLTRPEYETLGLEVVEYWKRKPPTLRCLECGAPPRSIARSQLRHRQRAATRSISSSDSAQTVPYRNISKAERRKSTSTPEHSPIFRLTRRSLSAAWLDAIWWIRSRRL